MSYDAWPPCGRMAAEESLAKVGRLVNRPRSTGIGQWGMANEISFPLADGRLVPLRRVVDGGPLWRRDGRAPPSAEMSWA